jgi:hypothetical protein
MGQPIDRPEGLIKRSIVTKSTGATLETSLTATAWEVRSSPSRGAIIFLQLTDHCPTRALVEGGIRDRWSPGELAGAITIYMRPPLGMAPGERYVERDTHGYRVGGEGLRRAIPCWIFRRPILTKCSYPFLCSIAPDQQHHSGRQ